MWGQAAVIYIRYIYICIQQADSWFPYVRKTRFLPITMLQYARTAGSQVEVFRSRGENTQLAAKELPAKTLLDVEVKLKG